MSEPALLTALRNAYRKFAGPEASLSSIPLAVMRRIYGDDYVVRIDGKPFTVNLRDTVVSFQILVSKKYETFETSLFRKLIVPGAHVVDVGANIGFFTVLFGEVAGNGGRILAIEPEPNNARLLRKNVSDRDLLRTVEIAQTAVGDSTGTASLHKASSGNQGDHRLYASQGPGAAAETIEVPIARIDDLVAGWPHVDFIKMDIQGFEPYALTGMSQTLASNTNVVLFSEFWPFGIRGAGCEPRAYLQGLRDRGFAVWELREESGTLTKLDPAEDERTIDRIEPNAGYANLLCARTDEALGRVSSFMQSVRT